jgi:hypothetical protein
MSKKKQEPEVVAVVQPTAAQARLERFRLRAEKQAEESKVKIEKKRRKFFDPL